MTSLLQNLKDATELDPILQLGKEITLNLMPKEVNYLETLLAREYEDHNISESDRMVAYKLLTNLQENG